MTSVEKEESRGKLCKALHSKCDDISISSQTRLHEKLAIASSYVPVQYIPILPSPLVLVVNQIKSPKLLPVALEHREQAVGQRLPEAIEVDLCVAFVETEEERGTGHFPLDGVLELE